MKKKCIVAIIFSIVLILLTIILFFIDIKFVPSPIEIDVDQINFPFWSIYFSFVGSIIAGILTFRGVKTTIQAQHEEKEAETKRLVMPAIQIDIGEPDYRWAYIQFDFNLTSEGRCRPRKNIPDTEVVTLRLKNVGVRELLELHIGNFQSSFFDEGGHCYTLSPIMYANGEVMLNLYLYEKGIYDDDCDSQKFDTLISPIFFSCFFKDCLGNWYQQDFSIALIHSLKKDAPIEVKALAASIERCQIMSAPKDVTEKELPWNIAPEKLVLN